jgi:hypothetical protein
MQNVRFKEKIWLETKRQLSCSTLPKLVQGSKKSCLTCPLIVTINVMC